MSISQIFQYMLKPKSDPKYESGQYKQQSLQNKRLFMDLHMVEKMLQIRYWEQVDAWAFLGAFLDICSPQVLELVSKDMKCHNSI